jgi:hypothetical protein
MSDQRDHRGRFAPGHRGLGGRRPGPSFARLIGQETRDGAELVEYAIRVLRDADASEERRWSALVWLADRYAGKPAAPVDVSVSTPASLPPDWSALTPAERMAYLDRVAPPLLGAGDP